MRIIEPATEADFEQYYQLRYDVLRAPWQQPPGTERASDDDRAIHAMLLDPENRAAGVCRLHFENEEEGQLRFMAIREDLQNQGLGKYLLHYLEDKARDAGCKYITLQARELAVNFYKRYGYKVVKKTHLLFGSIQHYQMEKYL
ncbi:GNAT family N-acetyltransferase [Adhaeribacter terreus]|uniref:GNAT family N-acetyltransferase n=1 Tax=Adhaeribacter terreus TaxID=529703 RepID=A0ABW0E894_9BACT